MKILFLQDDFPPHVVGGAGVVAAALARELVHHGHQVTVATAVQNPAEAGAYLEDGMHIERIYSKYAPRWRAWRSLYNPAVIPRMRRLLQQIEPEVVHAHNVHYYLSYHSLRLAKASGARVILTAHDAMLFHYGKLTPELSIAGSHKVSARQQLLTYKRWYNPFRNTLIRMYLHSVDCIIAVSFALRTALLENSVAPIRVIHNGIDVSTWRSDSTSTTVFKEQFGLVGKRPILFAGRLSSEKGVDSAIDSLAKVVHSVPDAVLIVVGIQDSYAHAMQIRAKTLSIQSHLVFTGWLSGAELKAAYDACEVVCVLSTYLDPFPTVVLEAMASGKPVVGTKFGGTPEAVVEGETGYVINPLDTDSVASRITQLLQDPNLASHFGVAGRVRAEAKFSLKQMADQYLQAYSEAV